MKKFSIISIITLCLFVACNDAELGKVQEKIEQAQKVNDSTEPFNPFHPLISAGLGLALAVVEHKRRKHAKANDHIHNALENGFQEGSDQTVLHLNDLSKHLDTNTKNKFNKKGSIKLKV